MNTNRLLITSVIVAGSGALVVGASAAPPASRSFDFKAHGLYIERSNNNTHENHANGRVTMKDRTRVGIDGLGTRTLTSVVEDDPVALGGVQKTTITDPDAGNTTVFSYTPATNSITISDGTTSTVVVQNADHTYSVDGVAAAGGKAAVELLKDKPAYQAASPHAVMLAYSYAHAPNAAVKNTENCDLPGCCDGTGPNGEKGWGELATPPAVCTTFQDFCECAACDKTGRGAACQTCE